MDKKVLGKGLSALIPEKIRSTEDSGRKEEITFLNINLIKDNSQQPRTNYDDFSMQELQSSLKEKGLLQPLLVRKIDNGYEVIAGERRLRAARAIKLEEVPVIIRNVENDEALVLALIENIQREDLNSIEAALAYKRLIDEYELSYDQIAQAVGKDASTVNNTLRLLKLPAEIQEKVISGEISMGHARALVGIEDSKWQSELFNHVLTKKISVRELENLIRSSSGSQGTKKKKKAETRDHEILYLEDELQKLLGTKVSIQSHRKRGKLIVEFYSVDDLERILQIIRNNLG